MNTGFVNATDPPAKAALNSGHLLMTQHNDMLIVGAGILGVSHAYAAARRGLKVTIFERSETPLGASIRNFGQVLVTGQPPARCSNLPGPAMAERNVAILWESIDGPQ
jgi:glycine/D-amino acid oxidase-like deaminating enzyme